VTPTNTSTPTVTPTNTTTPTNTPTNTQTPTMTPTPSAGYYGFAFLIDEPASATTEVATYLATKSTTFRGFSQGGAADATGLQEYFMGIESGAITGCSITRFEIPQSGLDQYIYDVTGNTLGNTNTWVSLFVESSELLGGNCQGYAEWEDYVPSTITGFESALYEIELSITNTGEVGAGNYYRCYTTWPDQNLRRSSPVRMLGITPVNVCP